MLELEKLSIGGGIVPSYPGSGGSDVGFEEAAEAAYGVIDSQPQVFFQLMKTAPSRTVYEWATTGLRQPLYKQRMMPGALGWSVAHEKYMLGWLIVAGVLDADSSREPSIPLPFLSLVLGYETKLGEQAAFLDRRGMPSFADSVVCHSFVVQLSKHARGWREEAAFGVHQLYDRSPSFFTCDGCVQLIQGPLKKPGTAESLSLFFRMARARATIYQGFLQGFSAGFSSGRDHVLDGLRAILGKGEEQGLALTYRK